MLWQLIWHFHLLPRQANRVRLHHEDLLTETLVGYVVRLIILNETALDARETGNCSSGHRASSGELQYKQRVYGSRYTPTETGI